MRTRAERRKNNVKKAIRKRDIAERNYGYSYYDNLHQYSKNKIHSSSTTNGRKHSEELRVLSMNEDEKSFNEEE